MTAGPPSDLTVRFGELTRLGVAETVAGQGLGATLRPSAEEPASEASWSAVGQTLPVLGVATSRGGEFGPGTTGPAELQMGVVLGEGGMGIVHLALQRPLARDVAVKSVKLEFDQARTLLVREAITTGGLKHPNIVPIHTLGKDAQGAPLLVMKRITGVPWLDLIHDPRHPAWSRVTGDALEFHLDVLMQVANAVHFAHSKRVLHRDLKPENVMIGDFGEVYVLDWGIALSLDGPREARESLSGTPAYMAPEMARGDAERISERTDVYLLGAILHEVLTGAAPHGGTLYEALMSACTSEDRAYGESVPRPLAAIAARAMRLEPSERFASADEFRRAVAEFLRQRSSLRVSDEAESRLVLLSRHLALGSEAEAIGAYNLFGECRFGFRHAMQTFAENGAARRGLSHATALMVSFELSRRNAEAASVLLAELPEPPPELVRDLERLRQELVGEHEELAMLRRLEHDVDARVGSRARAAVALLVGLGFNAGVLLVMQVAWGSNVTLPRAVGIAVAFLVSVAVAAFIAKDVILQNAANRRLALALGVASLAMLAHRLVLLQLDAPVATAFVGDALLLAVSGGTVAATLDRRFLPVAGYLFLVPFALALRPDWMPYTFPLAATLGALVLAASWRK